MPTTDQAEQPPAVDQPRHPIGALTTSELATYRRELERAIAYFDRQDPVPPCRADLQAKLDLVIAECESRERVRERVSGK